MTRFALAFIVSALSAQAAVTAADSQQGAQLFQSLHCVQCHSVNGQGGTLAPDLGRIMDRSFTPASLAATMWNHAPTMWKAMRQQNVQAGDLTPQAAADLFAYFYSRGFFEKPGDAARGKRAFASNHCAECHGLTTAKLPEAKPVSEWGEVKRPIALVNAMWNHAVTMREEFAKQKINWPQLTSQSLTDILVYLRNLPGTRAEMPQFEINAGADGQALFASKGCAECHTDALALESRLKGKALTDIAVAMWNHAPTMRAQSASLDLEQMRSLLSYLWAQTFFQDSGNPGTGQKVFTAKRCSSCHGDPSSGAPKLPEAGKSFDGAMMVSALWQHGPSMMQQMEAKGIPWPAFKPGEMSNVLAYLNSAK
jgi:mono/diheme cytochrome c family protein